MIWLTCTKLLIQLTIHCLQLIQLKIIRTEIWNILLRVRSFNCFFSFIMFNSKLKFDKDRKQQLHNPKTFKRNQKISNSKDRCSSMFLLCLVFGLICFFKLRICRITTSEDNINVWLFSVSLLILVGSHYLVCLQISIKNWLLMMVLFKKKRS